MSLIEKIDHSNLPKHIAVIMDGNGRWAKKRGLPRIMGHRAAVRSVRKIVEECAKLKIEVLTLYAFSTENWTRPGAEVSALMGLLGKYLKAELETMQKNDVRLETIGDISRLPKQIKSELDKTCRLTRENTGLRLNLALNYGSRAEIVFAVNKLLDKGQPSVSESDISKNLFTAGLPDPDLVIRTSGEQRLSNFLLWQAAYAELYFTPVLWPDFGPGDLHEAIIDYQKRTRRFGGI